jgi:hypothetical protein
MRRALMTGGMSSDEAANRRARQTAAMIFVLGMLVVVLPALWHLGAVTRDPFTAPTSTKTVTTQVGKRTTSTVTTRSESSQSLLDRGLAAGGLLILRLGIVALAAFLAGAVVQRIKLGDFQLKLGPLEVPALQRLGASTEKSVETLTAAVADNKTVTERAARGIVVAANELEALRQRVEVLEQPQQSSATEDQPSASDS